MAIRIATFNVENLMERVDFSKWRKAQDKNENANRFRSKPDDSQQIQHFILEDDARKMTAKAIEDCHADLICLQEVENLAVLQKFEEEYLKPLTGLTYPQKMLIEGNDGRGIDVAFMARETTRDGERIEVVRVKSHAKRTFGELKVYNKTLQKMGYEANERVFRRDCLEVNLKIGGKRVTVFVCHFKSMGSGKENVDGRQYTMPVRSAEAEGVRRIIEEKFGSERAKNMRWIICGDLNDYVERLEIEGTRKSGFRFEQHVENRSGLDPLVKEEFCENLVQRRDGDNRWSLYFEHGASGKSRHRVKKPIHHLVQLDYILVSPAISKSNPNALPHIVRNGQPLRTVFPPDMDVERYPKTGWDRPKASDHCPVVVTLRFA